MNVRLEALREFAFNDLSVDWEKLEATGNIDDLRRDYRLADDAIAHWETLHSKVCGSAGDLFTDEEAITLLEPVEKALYSWYQIREAGRMLEAMNALLAGV